MKYGFEFTIYFDYCIFLSLYVPLNSQIQWPYSHWMPGPVNRLLTSHPLLSGQLLKVIQEVYGWHVASMSNLPVVVEFLKQDYRYK